MVTKWFHELPFPQNLYKYNTYALFVCLFVFGYNVFMFLVVSVKLGLHICDNSKFRIGSS